MTDLSNEIRTIVRNAMDSGAIGGAVVLVQRDGQIVDLQAQGYADFDPAFELHTDSVFGVMSMTKPIIAACILILQSEGRLSLDDPASRYIPEFSKPRQVRTLQPGQSYPPFLGPEAPDLPEPLYDYAPARQEITVRHLLNFTSGLQTIGVPVAMPGPLQGETLASFIPKLADLPLELEPGSRWHYSNMTGYDVLGRIIEIASGQKLEDFARDRLFAPLGMNETAFGPDSALQDRTPSIGSLANLAILQPGYPSGSAGLYSTAKDYAQFAQMLLDGGSYAGREIMKPQGVSAMHQPQIGGLPFEGIRVSDYATPVHSRPSAFSYGYGVGILMEPTDSEAVPSGSYGWDGAGTRRFWVMPSLGTVLIMLVAGVGNGADPAHKEIEAAVVRWVQSRV